MDLAVVVLPVEIIQRPVEMRPGRIELDLNVCQIAVGHRESITDHGPRSGRPHEETPRHPVRFRGEDLPRLLILPHREAHEYRGIVCVLIPE